MSNQPPDGQGSWQQPPGPPGQDPAGPPPEYGPGDPMGGPPGKSKAPVILGAVGGVVAVIGAGLLLYFFVFNSDDEASGDDYCTLLEDNAEFAGLTSDTPDSSEMDNAVAVVHQLREAAPEEVADEWAAIDDPLQDFQQALDDAGSSWEEVDQAQSPDDVPPPVAEAMREMLAAINQLDFDAMTQTISDHAKDECNIDLQEVEQNGS